MSSSDWKKSTVIFSEKMLIALFLVVLLSLALYFRVESIWFSYPLITHADEPKIIGIAGRMLKNFDFNPHFFRYPSLVIYIQAVTMKLTAGIYYVTAGIGPSEIPRVDFHVAGRLVASLASVGSIFLTYVVGAKLFNRTIGLVAAGFLAVSPMHVHNSALVTTDIWVAIFSTLVLYFCAQIYQQQRTIDYVFAGLCVGLAASSKYTAVVFCFSIFMAHVLSNKDLWSAFINKRLWLAAAFTVVAFVATTPFSIFDSKKFISDVLREGRHYRTGHLGAEAPGDLSYELYANVLVSNNGLGLIAILLAIFSLLVAFKKEYRSVLFVAILPIMLFLFVGNYKVFFSRNIVGALPALALLCSVSIYFIFSQLPLIRNRQFVVSGLCAISLAILAWPLAVKATEDVRIKNLPDTRLISLKWAEANLPAGSKVAVERYAPPVEQSKPGFNVVKLGIAGLLKNRHKIDRDVEFVILSSGSYGRFFDRNEVAKEMYQKEAQIYENFFKSNKLIYELRAKPQESKGPTIIIYDISP